MVATLDENIAAYENMRGFLETEHFGKWVLFYNQEFIGAYDEFEEVAQEAVSRFGRGPYLMRRPGIRKVVRIPYLLE